MYIHIFTYMYHVCVYLCAYDLKISQEEIEDIKDSKNNLNS